MQNYEPHVIPGLLQTEEYATAIMHATLVDPEDVANRVAVRLARQEALTRKDPLQVWAVIDESVLRRPIGGPAVMQRTSGPIIILEFHPDDPPVVYLEGARNDLYIEKAADIRWFILVFNHLRALALSPRGSVALIRAAAKEMT